MCLSVLELVSRVIASTRKRGLADDGIFSICPGSITRVEQVYYLESPMGHDLTDMFKQSADE